MCICKLCDCEIILGDDEKIYSPDPYIDYRVHADCLDSLADAISEQETIDFLTFDL